jgi:hypothetical protein
MHLPSFNRQTFAKIRILTAPLRHHPKYRTLHLYPRRPECKTSSMERWISIPSSSLQENFDNLK